jgi:hypothetical protein
MPPRSALLWDVVGVLSLRDAGSENVMIDDDDDEYKPVWPMWVWATSHHLGGHTTADARLKGLSGVSQIHIMG